MLSTLPITSLTAAVLGIMLFYLSLRAGLFRVKTGIFFQDGGDEQMMMRIRAQGNFTEYVPLSVIVLALMESNGAGTLTVCLLGTSLILGRASHALSFHGTGKGLTRPIGMVLTFITLLGASGWLFYAYFAGGAGRV